MNTAGRHFESPSISFTPEEIERWEAERDRLKSLISESHQRLAAINQLLGAAAVLNAGPVEPQAEAGEEGNEPEELDPANLMGSIVKIVSGSSEPMTKAELKEALHKAGVDPGRIKGTYFYVALNRLKKHGRIVINSDGTVERPIKRRSL
jgi:hypothetical protein